MSVSNEAKVIEDIFPCYNKHCKPTVDAHKSITVYIHFALARIESLVSTDVGVASVLINVMHMINRDMDFHR